MLHSAYIYKKIKNYFAVRRSGTRGHAPNILDPPCISGYGMPDTDMVVRTSRKERKNNHPLQSSLAILDSFGRANLLRKLLEVLVYWRCGGFMATIVMWRSGFSSRP